MRMFSTDNIWLGDRLTSPSIVNSHNQIVIISLSDSYWHVIEAIISIMLVVFY